MECEYLVRIYERLLLELVLTHFNSITNFIEPLLPPPHTHTRDIFMPVPLRLQWRPTSEKLRRFRDSKT
jgi:hypothetical protein